MASAGPVQLVQRRPAPPQPAVVLDVVVDQERGVQQLQRCGGRQRRTGGGSARIGGGEQQTGTQALALAGRVVADEIVEIVGRLAAGDGFGHRRSGQLGVVLEGLDRAGRHVITAVIGSDRVGGRRRPAPARGSDPGRRPTGTGYRSRTEAAAARGSPISAGANTAVPPGQRLAGAGLQVGEAEPQGPGEELADRVDPDPDLTETTPRGGHRQRFAPWLRRAAHHAGGSEESVHPGRRADPEGSSAKPATSSVTRSPIQRTASAGFSSGGIVSSRGSTPAITRSYASPASRRASSANAVSSTEAGSSEAGLPDRHVPTPYQLPVSPLINRSSEDGVGRLQSAHGGRLDAAGVESAVGPVAGQHQVVVAGLVHPQPMPVTARQRLHVALGPFDVGPDVLAGQPFRTVAGGATAVDQQVPVEPLRPGGTRPEVAGVIIQETGRVRRHHRLRVGVGSPRCATTRRSSPASAGRSSSGHRSCVSRCVIDAYVSKGGT